MGFIQRGVLWWLFLTSLVGIQMSVAHRRDCVAPKFHRKPVKEVVVKPGGKVKLHCQISVAGLVQYMWYKDGKRLHDNNHLRVRPKRHLKIKRTNIKDNGKYTCVARNACGFVNATIQLIVHVIVPPKVRAGPPKLTLGWIKRGKTFVAVPVGQPIRLDCSASGYPLPVIKWYKDGKPFTRRNDAPVNLGPYHFVLRLKHVVPFDSGVYTCNVSNVYGWFNHSYTVDVRVRLRAKPVIQEINNVTVSVGQNATLECKAMSDSMPHFQWVRWFAPVFNATTNKTEGRYETVKQKAQDSSHHIAKPKSSKTFVLDHVQKLTIANVTKADEGKYTCIVGNAMGYNNEHGYLIVRDRSVPEALSNTEVY